MDTPILRNRINKDNEHGKSLGGISAGDTEYIEAAKEGDIEKCSEMVRRRAESAFMGTKVAKVDGGEPKVVYHSSNSRITDFDHAFIPAGNVGFHFGSEDVANVIMNNKKGLAPKGYYLFIGRPMFFDIDCFGESTSLYNELDVGRQVLKNLKNSESGEYQALKSYVDSIEETNDDERYSTDDEFNYDDAKYKKLIIDAMESEGFDGIKYFNTFEGHHGDNLCWVAIYPEQIKSADAITYDREGNVVPLSKRFDFTSRFVSESSAPEDSVEEIRRIVSDYDKGRMRRVKDVVEELDGLLEKGMLPVPVARFVKAYKMAELPENSDADACGDEFIDDIRNWLENPVNEDSEEFDWSKFEDDDVSCSGSDNIPTSLTAKDVKGMEKMFGTTRNVEDVYFIMPDGEWLDFSGIPEKVCHRYSFWGPEHPLIGLYYGGKPSTLIRDELVKLGMIRVTADSKTPLIAIGKDPNDVQYESISEFLHDLVRMMYEGEGQFGDDPELVLEIGHGSFSKTYNVDQLKSVIPDIRKFFSGEKPRNRSVVQQFHESENVADSSNSDEEYEKLAASDRDEDRKLAYEMLSLKAKEAMPRTKVANKEGFPVELFHGTSSYGFRSFAGNNGFWASTNRDYAFEFTGSRGYANAGVYKLFMNIEDPFEAGYLDDLFMEEQFEMFARNMGVERIELEEWLESQDYDWREYAMNVWEITKNPLFVEWLCVLGFDGMHGTESSSRIDTWCAFGPHQVKSAELITKRDDGTVIPLSKRFDMGSSDLNESDNDDEVVISNTNYGYSAKIGDNEVCRCDITVGYGDRILDELVDSIGYHDGFKSVDPLTRTVYIEDIDVDEQVMECGIGTKVMNRVVSDYSSCQMILRAFNTSGKSDPERLVAFYKRFGFDPIADTESDGTVMLRRKPKCHMVTESSDDDIYMHAAEAGDVKTCKAMVAAKAKEAFSGSVFVYKDGTPIVLYHGTAFNIHKFEGGLDGITWVTADKKYADIYADMDRHPDSDNAGVIMPLYVKAVKVARLGDINEEYSEDGVRRLAKAIGCDYEYLKKKTGKYDYGFLYEINEYVAQIARENGFDALIAIEGGKDKNGWGFPYKVETIGVLNFNCIKSAEAITRYEDGTVVPLSKRFYFSTDDIREDDENPVDREANLKRWFGNSKVKNCFGEPLAVYHGSHMSGISEFKNPRPGTGIFFTSSIDVANDYAVTDEKKIYKCYLKIEHPFVIDAGGSKWSNMMFSEKRFVIKYAGYRWITPLEVIGYVQDVYAKEHPECDGVIIRNVIDTNASKVVADDYIVFHPNQIKSVDNNGNFSDSPNIFESVETAEEVPPEPKEVELEKSCWKNPDDWKSDEYLVEFKNHQGYPDDYFPDKTYAKCADSVAREYTLNMPTDTMAREIEGDAVMMLIKSGLKKSIKVAHVLGDILMGKRKGGPNHKRLLKAMRDAYLELNECSNRFDPK